MHCQKWMKPIVSPTKCCNVHDLETINVPHIHPSHTTYHHHKLYKHLHSYPHTVSNVTDVAHQNYNCGAGMPGPGVPAPGPMAGAPMPGPRPPMPGAPFSPYGRP